MIIYYIIFGSVDVNIVLVGVLAFGINSGAYVAEIIRAGVNSIDKGQMEAVLSNKFDNITKSFALVLSIYGSLFLLLVFLISIKLT